MRVIVEHHAVVGQGYFRIHLVTSLLTMMVRSFVCMIVCVSGRSAEV
jgi:hypothetical protein